MEKVAATSNKMDSLVLLDDPRYADTAGSVVLHVVRHLRQPGQEFLEEHAFQSLDEALAFCERQYGVLPGHWQDVLPLNATFSFQYQVTHLGTPQPILICTNPGKIQFQVDRVNEGEASGATPYQLNISGDRDGLRRLAALFWLAAESENLDREYHQHLDVSDHVLGNVNVIIRGPGYFVEAEKETDKRSPAS